MQFDYTELSPAQIYKLMSQTIVPRPIAWIVTQNHGVTNVAPFSYFTGLSSQPPTMLVSIGHKHDGSPKDTLRNLRETGRATVCIAATRQLEALHLSSAALGADESEAERFDIALSPFIEGFAPRIAEAPVAFACELHSEIALEGSPTVPLVLKIHHQYIDDTALIDAERLAVAFDPIARIGAGYARIGETLDAPELL